MIPIISFVLSFSAAIFLSIFFYKLTFIGLCIMGSFLVYVIAQKNEVPHGGLRAIACFFLSTTVGLICILFLLVFDDLVLVGPVCCIGAFLISVTGKR